MERKALIIGAGPSGIRAALDIAATGIEVHVVEKEPCIGGTARSHVRVDPSGEDSYYLMNPMFLEAATHPLIHIHTLTEISGVEGRGEDFRATLAVKPRYIDERVCTGCGQCMLACPVEIRDDGLFGRTTRKPVYVKDPLSVPLTYAIQKEDRPPCVQRCPVHLNIQGYVALIAKGKYKEAYDLIRERLPLPAVCGRVCFHPCEEECNRSEIDEPIAINLLKRFVTEYEEKHAEPVRFVTEKQRVAIIGSGPAGLTAAYELAKKGYRPTIFEALPEKGGMLRVGIPSYRLPRRVLEREIDYIERSGVEIRTGIRIGRDVTIDGLFEQGFAAVFIAVGGHKSRALGVPGETLQGVVSATDFLREVNLTGKFAMGREVIVIGGGNVALDCARTAVRLGPDEVKLVCLESRDLASKERMPAHEWEIEHALEEGIVIVDRCGPKQIMGDGERVSGIETLDVKSVFDEQGRFNPSFHPGTEKTIRGDMVILAIGQFPDLSWLREEDGIELTKRGTVKADPVSLATSRPGVFAGGEVATGPSMAIEAIAMGRSAAFSIDQYLRGETPRGEDWAGGRDGRTEDGFRIPDEVPKARRQDPGRVSARERARNFDEVEFGLIEEMAKAEAKRCLSCGICSECMECVRACEVLGAIHHDEEKKEVPLEDVGAIVLAAGEGAFSSSGGRAGTLAGILGVRVDATGKIASGKAGSLETSAPGIYVCGGAAGSRSLGESLEQGSSVASLVQEKLWNSRKRRALPALPAAPGDWAMERTAVFVCECGGSTSSFLDVEGLASFATGLPGVTHSEVVTYLCSDQGVHQAVRAIEREKITRVVTASCSCCSLEQICTNCSTQRIRQKESLYRAAPLPRSLFEPINIREQCAWAHHDDPGRALEKANELLAMAVMRAGSLTPHPVTRCEISAGVLVCGSGHDAIVCAGSLSRKGFRVSLMPVEGEEKAGGGKALEGLREAGVSVIAAGRPEAVRAYGGHVLVRCVTRGEEKPMRYGAVVLTGEAGPRSSHPVAQPFETSQRGVFRSPPERAREGPGWNHSGAGRERLEMIGMALSSKVSAYLSQRELRAAGFAPGFDPFWCRGCGICTEVCEFGAFELVDARPGMIPSGDGGFMRSSMIRELCRGCSTCSSYCPTGALAASHASTASLNSMFTYLGNGAFPAGDRIIVFACHWSNYAGADLYSMERFRLPPEVRVVRVTCAGRLEESMIIKAFTSGARGVAVMGCGEEVCHYHFGNKRGRERMERARELLLLLGIERERFLVTDIPAWETDRFQNIMQEFARTVRSGRDG